MSNAQTFLDKIRADIGAPPRSLGWFKPSPFSFSEPPWMEMAKDSDEPMKEIVRNQKTLWKRGIVVWGGIVRANNNLYQPGTDDCPGLVVFSPTAPDAEAVEELPGLVEKLWKLGDDEVPDPDRTQREREWWEDLQNGMSYNRGCKLPEEWQARTKDYKGSTILFPRSHLAGGVITSRLVPLLVDPMTNMVQLVPASRWPEGMGEWLEAERSASLSSAALELALGGSADFLVENPMNRQELEQAYGSVFGPVVSVYHQLVPLPHHIDIYRFRWEAPRDEYGYVTGGMSDAIQPAGGDFERIELVFYTKHHDERFMKLLQSFARYPWETGASISPGDTIPLGDYGDVMLGSDRFKALMFFPGVARPENPIYEAPCLIASNIRLLTVVPLTEAELNFKLSHDARQFFDLLREKRFDLAFAPDRACLMG